MRSFIAAIGYCVGHTHAIETLFNSPQVHDVTPQFFRERGLQNFCAQSESTLSMCRAAIDTALRDSGTDPRHVGTVVVDADYWHCSEEDITQILESLHLAGIPRVPILGLGLQTCSGSMTALDLADRLLRTDPQSRPILILVCGRAAPGASRIDTLRSTILSDGVAACVMTSKPRGYQLLASTCYTTLDTVRTNVVGDKPVNSLLNSYGNIGSLSRILYDTAGIQGRQIEALFCTNGSLMYTRIAADAAGVRPDRVVNDNIPKFAHMFSCDQLIGLATYAEAGRFRPGAPYLLLAWSPYVFSGALLTYIGHDR